MGTLLGACPQEMAIHIEGSKSPEDMWRILAGTANSADTETGRDLLFRELLTLNLPLESPSATPLANSRRPPSFTIPPSPQRNHAIIENETP